MKNLNRYQLIQKLNKLFPSRYISLDYREDWATYRNGKIKKTKEYSFYTSEKGFICRNVDYQTLHDLVLTAIRVELRDQICSFGFKVIDTGGGCTLYIKDDSITLPSDIIQLTIRANPKGMSSTEADGCNIPEYPWDKITLGITRANLDEEYEALKDWYALKEVLTCYGDAE